MWATIMAPCYGGIVAGVERRAKTYVLMAAPGTFSDLVAQILASHGSGRQGRLSAVG